MRDLPVIKDLDLNKPETFGNLAEKLDRDQRRNLAIDLTELIKIDEVSMSDWAGEAEGYLDEVEADRGNETPQNREQEGSGEQPPPSTELTLTAMVQFAARATAALLGEPDLAKASEVGGEALASWVSSQLRTKDPNWTLDTDPLVVHMSVTGLAWRKRSFDDIEKVFHSYFVPSCGRHKVIINKSVRNVERAPRITEDFERYPYEIERSIQRKRWVDYEPLFDEADPQAPKRFYEVDCWLDLDGDEIDEPWTIVISRDDHAEVVRVKPRWSKKTVVSNADELYFNPIHQFFPYRFLPDPKGGFFPMGFGKLLRRVEGAADRLLAAITDTAESQAENGGVMGGSQFGLPGSIEIKTNRITTIPTDGAPLASQLQMFPTKQLTPATVQVLEKLITIADRMSGSLNALENAPSSMTATLAKGVIDNGTQVQSAVHRRMVASMTQEFRNFVKMADAYEQLPDGVNAQDGGGVAVTADPQLATEMQRAAQIGFLFELLKLPNVFNPQTVGAAILTVARMPNAKMFLAPPPGPPQATPDEKMKGILGLMKQRTESIKVTGQVAVQLTQAMLNMVQAAGGMQNNKMALLTMAQLEQAVQQMVEQAGNAGTDTDGLGAKPGDASPAQLPAPAAGGDASGVPGGDQGSGPPDAGAGGGLS